MNEEQDNQERLPDATLRAVWNDEVEGVVPSFPTTDLNSVIGYFWKLPSKIAHWEVA